MNIKLLHIILLILSPSFPLFGQIINSDSLKTELIGTWEFVELRDKHNKKVDTIKHPFGYEIPKGPLITYRANGTYSKQFTPKNTDSGKWYFDRNQNAIIHYLYYTKPYDFVEKSLIEKGHAIKDGNGEYYEINIDKVIELTNIKLTISERNERHRSFKKKG